MDMELFAGISDEMDIWCGDDVDMWESHSGDRISNESLGDVCKNAFDTNKVKV